MALDNAYKQKNVKIADNILMRTYSLIGKDDAERFGKERLQEKPDSFAANYTMYNLEKMNGNYNNAIKYIDRCIQITGTDSLDRLKYTVEKVECLNLAYKKTSDNTYLQRAADEYESLLTKMPNNTDVLNNLAYTLAECNVRLDDAIDYARRAHEDKPNNASFLDTYAYVLYKNGQFEKAEEFLKAAMQQYEVQRINVPAAVYEHLGMIKEKLGEANEALDVYLLMILLFVMRVAVATLLSIPPRYLLENGVLFLK